MNGAEPQFSVYMDGYMELANLYRFPIFKLFRRIKLPDLYFKHTFKLFVPKIYVLTVYVINDIKRSVSIRMFVF